MESFLSQLIVSSPAVAHSPPFHTDMAESSESTHSLTRHDPCKTSSLLPHTRNLLYPQSQFIRTPPHQPYHITFAPQKVSRIPVEKTKKDHHCKSVLRHGRSAAIAIAWRFEKRRDRLLSRRKNLKRKPRSGLVRPPRATQPTSFPKHSLTDESLGSTFVALQYLSTLVSVWDICG